MTSEREKNQPTGTSADEENEKQEGSHTQDNSGNSVLERLQAELNANDRERSAAEAETASEEAPAPPAASADEAPASPAPEETGPAEEKQPPAPAAEEGPGEESPAAEEEVRPEQLGEGLSILGAVGLERESLEAPASSPEVIQPDVLDSPIDKAYPAPGATPAATAEDLSPAHDEVQTAPASAGQEQPEQATETETPKETETAEKNQTEAPVVEEGATQSDVLTSQDPPVTDSGRPSPAAVHHPEEDHDHDHELEESADHDLDHLSLAELQARLFQRIKEPGANRSPRHVFELHRRFDQAYNAEKATALERFVQEGGTAEDFEYSGSRQHQEVEQAIQQFRESRHRDQRQEEENKGQNLIRKRELLDELRELVEAAETGHSGEKLKSIQARWKAIGQVPQGEAQELWNSYHALLDIYYNNRSIYNELKELDRKRNYDLKVQLCERAEALAQESSINKSLQELRHLHEEWKNVGPVPNEVRDSIWERFIQASEQVHQRKKEYLAKRNVEEEANLRLKLELISRIEPLPQFSSDRINDWRERTDEIQKLKEEWDKVGLVPKADADSVNKRFWGAYKAFFQHKNQFFKSLDEQKLNNLRLKTELCEEAEALRDHPDWNDTREKFIQLQKKWKTIGRVPEKHSDKIWDRFRTACNAFFDRKNQEVRQRDAELDRQSAEKENYLQETGERLEQVPAGEANLAELNAILQRWDELDSGGQRVNHKLEDKFYGMLEKYLQKIPGTTPEQQEQLKFQLQVGRMKSHPDGSQKIHQKEQAIRREINDLENDIRTLQTNVEFFGRSKSAEKLREEYSTKIEEANKRIDYLKRQLKVLRGG
jgi:hypothetical protein